MKAGKMKTILQRGARCGHAYLLPRLPANGGAVCLSSWSIKGGASAAKRNSVWGEFIENANQFSALGDHRCKITPILRSRPPLVS
jgi:hypothetical protein